MFRGLPSPSALRTFESAARLGSFKAAALELCVSPTAVSHQVRALETSLDVLLFVRQTRRIVLTEAGAALAPGLTRGFSEIKAAFDDVLAAEAVITVSTTAAFATLRLVPALPAFYERVPGVRVQLDTSTRVVDLNRDRGVDVAIRYGHGPYEGLHEMPLVNEMFGAYASPSSLERPLNVSTATLLETRWQQDVLKSVNWACWLAQAGLEKLGRVVQFDEEHFVLQAAVAGQGIALASSVLAADFVERGLLAPVRPDVSLEGAAYTALCLERRAGTRRIRLFLDWLARQF